MIWYDVYFNTILYRATGWRGSLETAMARVTASSCLRMWSGMRGTARTTRPGLTRHRDNLPLPTRSEYNLWLNREIFTSHRLLIPPSPRPRQDITSEDWDKRNLWHFPRTRGSPTRLCQMSSAGGSSKTDSFSRTISGHGVAGAVSPKAAQAVWSEGIWELEPTATNATAAQRQCPVSLTQSKEAVG